MQSLLMDEFIIKLQNPGSKSYSHKSEFEVGGCVGCVGLKFEFVSGWKTSECELVCHPDSVEESVPAL